MSNDVLIKLANFFNVSTDYLLGLTNKALFALLSGSVDGALLSRIIEHPENRIEISHDIRQLNAEKICGDEADLSKLRNIFMSILKDIKADAIQSEHLITESDMANIVSSMLFGSGMADLDETETMLFYELIEHILERISKNSDFDNIE